MKAIISGAGIAGLSLGCCLCRDGWDVVIVERTPSLRNEGYMIDFMGSGYDVAERLGLLPRLKEIAYDIPTVDWMDGKGHVSAQLDYHRFAGLLDGRLLSLMRGDLERAIFEALPKSVDMRFDQTVAAIADKGDAVVVTLSDGTVETADLLVGADGIHSQIRADTFGDESRFSRYLGYHTAAFIYKDEAAVSDLGNRFRIMALPGRQVGFYPIRGGKVAAFFAHVAKDPALPDDPLAELRRVYGDLGWLVPRSLERAASLPGIYYDQIAQIEMDRWSKGRTTLIGDAADAVSLLAGQGASLAMGTAYVLAEELRRNTDVPSALAAYQQRLLADVRKKQESGRKTARWIVPQTKWDITLRNLTLRAATMPGLSWVLGPFLVSGTESIIERDEAA